MTRYQEAAYDLEVLRLPKMLYDLGRSDILDKLNHYALDYDNFYEIATVEADNVFEYVENGCDVNGDNYISIYSDPIMEEFYRLARRYSSKKKIPLKGNLYLLQAKAAVDRYLDFYGSSYELHTKAKNCCIVFYSDCFFDGQEELLEGLIEILNFFRKELAALRVELGVNPTSHEPLVKKAA